MSGTRGSWVVAVLFLTGCGARAAEERWPASTTQVASAHVPAAAYCSASYQAAVGWPDPEKASRVCACESRGNPRALSRDGLYAGLFQFSRGTWESVGGGDAFDPRTNSEHALRLWKKRGWQPWPVCGRR